jgi:hypothetical protein
VVELHIQLSIHVLAHICRTFNFQDVRTANSGNCTITWNAYSYDKYTGAHAAHKHT